MVLPMCANKLDINSAKSVSNRDNQAVIVAFDIEHHAIGCNKTCTGIAQFDVLLTLPLGSAGVFKPGLQCVFGGWVRLPKLYQGCF